MMEVVHVLLFRIGQNQHQPPDFDTEERGILRIKEFVMYRPKLF